MDKNIVQYALIKGNRVTMISKDTFGVHPSLKWVRCLSGLDVTVGWKYQDGAFIEHSYFDDLTVDEKRKSGYGTWQEQLDMLYHDMKYGTKNYVKHIDKIKEKYPKEKKDGISN